MGSDPFAGSAVSTNNASNALRTCHLKMALILDHVPQTPLLEGIQDWPRSCSREEWFRITRAIVAGVVADMAEDLTDAELSVVEQHFMSAGLL